MKIYGLALWAFWIKKLIFPKANILFAEIAKILFRVLLIYNDWKLYNWTEETAFSLSMEPEHIRFAQLFREMP